jgi:thiol-disulfide isomerase/thioredoxin
MRYLNVFYLLMLIVLGACSTSPRELKPGPWRAVIALQDQAAMPFTFDVTKDSSKYRIQIKNAAERLTLDEVTFFDDSVSIVLHIFDVQLRARNYGDSLVGYYIKNYEKDYRIPFKAFAGQTHRFEKSSQTPVADFTGTYSVTFVHDGKDTTLAVGVFKQTGDYAEGTFLTPTGDYRYLEGNVINDKLHLSTFDGNHAYLFTATQSGDTLRGEFWSGKTWHEYWTGIRNDQATLPDAESLTYLKAGYETLDFSFPDVQGNKVSLQDERYRGKVTVIQLFGTWCPNCMDETRFLTEWYNTNTGRGVEVIGLAFERKLDFTYASGRVVRMKEKLKVPYEFLIAPATHDKDEASRVLPALNQVVAFPTTIFVGKDGKVKHIHTGFSGPGTGIYYDQFKQRFNEIVNELLAEEITSKK